jgi:hypothetical protein
MGPLEQRAPGGGSKRQRVSSKDRRLGGCARSENEPMNTPGEH